MGDIFLNKIDKRTCQFQIKEADHQDYCYCCYYFNTDSTENLPN